MIPRRVAMFVGETSLTFNYQRGRIPMYATIAEATVRLFQVIEWRNHMSLHQIIGNFWVSMLEKEGNLWHDATNNRHFYGPKPPHTRHFSGLMSKYVEKRKENRAHIPATSRHLTGSSPVRPATSLVSRLSMLEKRRKIMITSPLQATI